LRNSIVKCTNCGSIAPRDHILPLCGECFKGLEDYEEFLAKSADNIELSIDHKPIKVDEFLRL
jgi:hypothetical protein